MKASEILGDALGDFDERLLAECGRKQLLAAERVMRRALDITETGYVLT